MEQYNLYYFTEFKGTEPAKVWSLKFIEAINLIEDNEIPGNFEIAPKNSKLRRICSINLMDYLVVFFRMVLHREDGPAVVLANGDKLWCINGQLHREEGPAIERANGDKHWYIKGIIYSP